MQSQRGMAKEGISDAVVVTGISTGIVHLHLLARFNHLRRCERCGNGERGRTSLRNPIFRP